MKGLVAQGDHPWQQPEHSKRTSERMKGLVVRGGHDWQQPEFIKAHRKRASEHTKGFVAQGNHRGRSQSTASVPVSP
jgi:hypothetical protein